MHPDSGTPSAPLPTPPSPMPPSAHPPQPPLSIAHLLVWTAATAVVLRLGRHDGSTVQFPQWYQSLLIAQELVSSPIGGVAVSSLLLSVYRRLTCGPLFPSQPGHWLLVTCGIKTIGACLPIVIFLHFRVDVRSPLIGYLLLTAGYIGGAAAAVVGSWRLRDRRVWRLLLLAAGLLDLLTAAVCWWIAFLANGLPPKLLVEALQSTGGLLLALLLSIMVGAELVRGVRRDWWHWVGVAISLIQPVLTFASIVLYCLAPAIAMPFQEVPS